MGELSILQHLTHSPILFAIGSLVVIIVVFLSVSLPKILHYLSSGAGKHKALVDQLCSIQTSLDLGSSRMTNIERWMSEMQVQVGALQLQVDQIHKYEQEARRKLALLIFGDDHVPIWERLDAGLEYLSLGGNHNFETRVADLVMQTNGGCKAWYDRVQKFDKGLPKDIIDYINSAVGAFCRRSV